MAKWLPTPLAGGLTATTRARDSDRQDTCTILDNALSDGEVSAEEHRERVSAATRAVTLGDLQALVRDLQSNTGRELPALDSRPRRPRLAGWGAPAAAFVVSVLLGMGIGWGLYGNTRSPLDFTTDPGAKPDGVAAVVLTPPTQLHSVGGLTGLLEQMRKRFGDAMGYRLVIYPTYAALDRPDPSDDRRILAYTYRGGWGDPNQLGQEFLGRSGAGRPEQIRRQRGGGHHARRPADPAHEAVRREIDVPDRRAGKRPDHTRGADAVALCLQ